MKTSNYVSKVLYLRNECFQCVFTFQIYLYEYENFQGRRMDLFGESRNLCEKGMERIGSIRVEIGP